MGKKKQDHQLNSMVLVIALLTAVAGSTAAQVSSSMQGNIFADWFASRGDASPQEPATPNTSLLCSMGLSWLCPKQEEVMPTQQGYFPPYAPSYLQENSSSVIQQTTVTTVPSVPSSVTDVCKSGVSLPWIVCDDIAPVMNVPSSFGEDPSGPNDPIRIEPIIPAPAITTPGPYVPTVTDICNSSFKLPWVKCPVPLTTISSSSSSDASSSWSSSSSSSMDYYTSSSSSSEEYYYTSSSSSDASTSSSSFSSSSSMYYYTSSSSSSSSSAEEYYYTSSSSSSSDGASSNRGNNPSSSGATHSAAPNCEDIIRCPASCFDGDDNDGRYGTDRMDPKCIPLDDPRCERPECEYPYSNHCNDARDNDGWGFADMDDLKCKGIIF